MSNAQLKAVPDTGVRARNQAPEELMRFADVLKAILESSGLSDRLKLTTIFFRPAGAGSSPRTYDSWEIWLQSAGSFGFTDLNQQLAVIRYCVEEGYTVSQSPAGLPGAVESVESRFDKDVGALGFVLLIIDNIDFVDATSTVVHTNEQKEFRERWYDFLIVRLALFTRHASGGIRYSMAVVKYGDRRILIPLSLQAGWHMRKHFGQRAECKFGGYVLPEDVSWKSIVQRLQLLCSYGDVLYMDSIYG